MKKTVLSFCLLAASLTPAFCGGAQKLVGIWKSDKQATLDYLKQHTKLTPEALARLEPTLGKIVIIYDGNTVTAEDGDWKQRVKYAVIRESDKAVTIQTIDPKKKQLKQDRLEFDQNGYWVSEERIPGYKERFEKVK